MDASAGAGSGNAPGAGASSCCYYAQLGIRKNASCTDIRAAYRRLAMKWHPDRWASDPGATGEAKQRFQRIQEAYSVLSDRGKRAMYDAGLFDPLDDDDQVESSSFFPCLLSRTRINTIFSLNKLDNCPLRGKKIRCSTTCR
uniref:Uncharacterized protein n=1 Tax=Avena sativa TaxID=4498 RepID=A0ACD5XKN9_AVESA